MPSPLTLRSPAVALATAKLSEAQPCSMRKVPEKTITIRTGGSITGFGVSRTYNREIPAITFRQSEELHCAVLEE